jgi:hypothetical protein
MWEPLNTLEIGDIRANVLALRISHALRISRPKGLAMFRRLLPPAALALGILIISGIIFADSARGVEVEPVEDWLAGQAAWFDAHPDLKSLPGSGWKPYNRAKWFHERNRFEGRIPSPAERWRASRARLEREAEAGWAGRSSWFSVGPTELSGRILDIAFDPTNTDIVYAGAASGGLWKSVDAGASWSSSTDLLPVLEVGAVAVLPSNPQIVLLGSGEGNGAGAWGLGMLRSTDGGATWEETSLSYEITDGHGFNAIAVNPITGVILAAARDGLWRSVDDGQNWSLIEDGRWYDVVWRPGDAFHVYAVRGAGATGNGVHLSTDGGLSFAYAGSGQGPSSIVGNSRLAVCPVDPDMVYVNFTNRSTNASLGIYRSLDNGANWEARNTSLNMTGGQGWYNVSLAVDPDDPERLIAGGVRLYQSDDGGVTLTETGAGDIMGTETLPHCDHHAAVYVPGSTSEIWVGSDGGIWRSTDDGHNWESRRSGLVTYQFYDIAVAQSDPIFMMGGTQDNGVPGRLGPDSWFRTTLNADGMVTCVSPQNHDHIFSEWQFGNLVRSFNGGASWTNIMNGITGSGAWVTPLAEDQVNPFTLFTSTSDGVFRTTSFGTVWEQVSSHTTSWIAVSPADPDVVWTIAGSSKKLSTDGGDSWQAVNPYGFPTPGASKILPHPTDPLSVFVTFPTYIEGLAHVAFSDDQGATWQDRTGDFPDQPVHAIAVDPLNTGDWYIGTDTGVWRSNNGGVNWLPYGDGLPHVVVTDLEINIAARKLVAGTYGRGAWEIDIGDLTAVEQPGHDFASPGLLLDPPYPNPGRDQITLRFASRLPGAASLTIYDVGGRRVGPRHVVRGDGIVRSWRWSPDDLPAGVYFAVLEAGEARASRKLVLSR